MNALPPARSANALDAELLPLLATVRETMAELLFGPDRRVLSQFLSVAPIGACVRLYEAWQAVDPQSEEAGRFVARLTPEDRFILDLVTAIYSVPDPADATPLFPDYRELRRIADGEVAV